MSTSIVTTSQIVRPPVAAGSHPIETGRYVISTPAIHQFYETLLLWIENRIPGGCLYSPPRMGKTRAIRFLRQLLYEKFGPKIPILNMRCREPERSSEKNFMQQLLRAAGHTMWTTGNATVMLHRLIELLVAQVEESGQSRLIWFLDEGQNLHRPEYNALITVHNELDRYDVAPIFIIVGQHQLMNQRNTFTESGSTQIVGRFMVHQCQFHGITNKKDLSACLKAYDEATEFPEDSGTSFTAYFFPAAFAAGFRLQSYAKDLWQSFKQVREECSLPGKLEIPMQYFCRTVEYVLKNQMSFELDPTISPNMWQTAIKASGFADAERYVNIEEDEDGQQS
jgi:hypothetical protein